MPTQRDVARAAGVSSATVSRYLADPSGLRKATAEKVREAVESLGYLVDYSAQCLKTGRYNHVGILAPGIGPFYWEVYTWLQYILNEAGYFCTLFFTRDVADFSHSFRTEVPPFLRKRQLDGLIFFPLLCAEDDALLQLLSEWGKPVVVVDRPLPDASFPQAFIDNYSGGWAAADALISAGHRDFLFVRGTVDSSAAQDRSKGFADRLAEARIPCAEDRTIAGDFVAATTYRATRDFLDRSPPFTAVFASNDSSAVGFMRAASERGLVCPRDYSIVGFDDNVEYTPFITPALSTFAQPLRELGAAAADILLRLIAGETVAQTRRSFAPRYVERESVAPPSAVVTLDRT